MRSLLIGGTRNLGPLLVRALLEQDHTVTVFNRGFTPDDLPKNVERLHGNRTDPAQLRAALAGREFDLVVDTTLYNGADALLTLDVLNGRCGRYIFLSTGQVYLVRVGVKRPFKEEDYPGDLMPRPPESQASDVNNWLYGIEKREVEDALALAWTNSKFPFTSLRLPMVNSPRDHYDRIYGYFLRLRDGGPIVIPDDSTLPLRHVYGDDVVQAVMRLSRSNLGFGKAYNIGQDESLSLEEFLRMMAAFMKRPLKICRVPREKLEAAGLLPDCSPFSGRWMSELDNTRSKAELGMTYTALSVYLKRLVDEFASAPLRQIEGYKRRAEELALAHSSASDR